MTSAGGVLPSSGLDTPPLVALPPVADHLPGLTTPPAAALSVTDAMPPAPPADQTPTIRAVADGRWSAPATWSGGRVPAAGDIVLIPRGRAVELAGATAGLNGLWIDGQLAFAADADVTLTSRYVMVHGALRAGTETQPYARRATVILTGTDTTQNVLGMGTKGIMVGSGGLLKLHGERRLAWTQLAASAEPGATSMVFKDAVDTWRVGDRLVVASSTFDPREAEAVTVTSVAGNTVTFTPAFKHRHLSVLQTYEGRTLDQRAAVGLLSRNIQLRGADDSDALAFGGHVMVMAGANAQLSGVEFFKMGQRGHFGRYPFHWHVAGDRPGNYVMGSSVNGSFQRAMVAHSTNDVTIDGNVAYDIPNHAFVWAEDGDERRNRLTRNLAVLGRSPAVEHFAFRINNPFHQMSSQSESRSALFWGTSFERHVIRDNIAAGHVDGMGFFFDTFSPAPKSIDGHEGGGFVFDGNIAHSVRAPDRGNQINYPEVTRGHGLMVSAGTSGRFEHVFSNFTSYHNLSAAWLEDRSSRLKQSIAADNSNGVMVLRGVIDDLVTIGTSANPVSIEQASASLDGVRAGISVAGSNHGGKRAPVILSAVIINQRDGTGFLWNVDNISAESYLGKLKFVNTPDRVTFAKPYRFEFFPNDPSFGLNDVHGIVAGDGQPARVFSSDIKIADSRCARAPDALAYVCPLAHALRLETTPLGFSDAMLLVEDDGQVTTLSSFGYDDDSMPSEGATSWIADGRRFTVVSNAPRSRHDFTLKDAEGRQVELMFAASNAASRVTQAGRDVPAMPSLSALRASSTSGHFHDAAASRLHVRLIGGAGAQAVVIEAPFLKTASNTIGRAPVALPSQAVDGFAWSAHRLGEEAAYRFRQSIPTVAAVRSGKNTSGIVNDASASMLFAGVGSTDATVVRGWVNAPVDGLYRLSLWGGGGSTSLYIGDTWIMGEPWANAGNDMRQNGAPLPEFGVFQPNGVAWLKAGWHPVTAVHVKFPEQKEGNSLILRWLTPSSGNNWAAVRLKREP